MVTKPDLCIYHGGECLDGFAAAWVVWRTFGYEMAFHKGVYGEPPPDVSGLNVAIVDFSYKRPVMEKLAAEACSILVLDHHRTAEEELRGLEDKHANLKIVFDMSRSGAVLAWEYFCPEFPVPRFLRYIEDRDLWTKKLPGVDEFTAALRSYPMDFAVWEDLFAQDEIAECRDGPSPLIKEGVAIQRYFRTLVEATKKHAFRRKVGDHIVPVVNASLFLASEVAGELAQGEPFAAMYAETADNVIWSLRSRAPDGLDVSEIARKWGGGGHRHAAGFTVPRG
jgi:uncharacterized protein